MAALLGARLTSFQSSDVIDGQWERRSTRTVRWERPRSPFLVFFLFFFLVGTLISDRKTVPNGERIVFQLFTSGWWWWVSKVGTDKRRRFGRYRFRKRPRRDRRRNEIERGGSENKTPTRNSSTPTAGTRKTIPRGVSADRSSR